MTALSFLGLGLRPPVVSWGVLLQKVQNLRTVALHPWLLIFAGFVVVTVLAFNFRGDGLSDVPDPYKHGKHGAVLGGRNDGCYCWWTRAE